MAIHFILPVLGELKTSLKSLYEVKLWWVLFGLSATIANIVLGSFATKVYAEGKTELSKLFAIQLSSSFLNIITPVSVGGAAVASKYFTKKLKMPIGKAVSAATIPTISITIIMLTTILISSPKTITTLINGVQVNRSILILASVAVLTSSLVLFTHPHFKDLRVKFKNQINGVLDLTSDKKKLGRLAMINSGQILLSVLTLLFCCTAFNVNLPMHVLVVVIAVAGVTGEVAPTPGGIGAEEAALAAGMGRLALMQE